LSAEARLRAKADATKQSSFIFPSREENWIASRSLSSGAHSREPLVRKDGARAAMQSPQCHNRAFAAKPRDRIQSFLDSGTFSG
jgi:hypothetical protein